MNSLFLQENDTSVEDDRKEKRKRRRNLNAQYKTHHKHLDTRKKHFVPENSKVSEEKGQSLGSVRGRKGSDNMPIYFFFDTELPSFSDSLLPLIPPKYFSIHIFFLINNILLGTHRSYAYEMRNREEIIFFCGEILNSKLRGSVGVLLLIKMCYTKTFCRQTKGSGIIIRKIRIFETSIR